MTPSPHIRIAIPSDAEAACVVVRKSITESCTDDHRGNDAVLAAWLANKTPEHMTGWIALPDAFAVVAESAGTVVGFALMNLRGDIRLCYVLPEAQRRGLGRAMMTALEEEATRLNLTEITLESTTTAHDFYRALGFVDSGLPRTSLSVTAQPMRKLLATGDSFAPSR